MVNIEYNKDLYRYNTMKLHCIAEMFCEPENIEEFSAAVECLKNKDIKYRILGAGSNIVLPSRLRGCVISIMKLNNEISFDGEKVICGASVRIQKLITTLQEHNLGGFEYLYSVLSTTHILS